MTPGTSLLLSGLTTLLCLAVPSSSVPFVVQQFSSRYALILGGYGPGYREVRQVDVVKQGKICPRAITDVPADPGRYLGTATGLAEAIGEDGDEVVFCRRNRCWRLDVKRNKWRKSAGFEVERPRAASASVGGRMLLFGGRDDDGTGEDVRVEEYDAEGDEWIRRDDWDMTIGRHSFCAVPVNSTAVMLIGGYSSSDNSATSSVSLLDVDSGRWDADLPPLPSPRYGHACLATEWEGRTGVLVSGGAATGRDVVFYDAAKNEWLPFARLPYHVDGHAMALVEGVPTVFSWERAAQFDGAKWRHAPEVAPTGSRSAFAVASVPGHLVRGCR